MRVWIYPTGLYNESKLNLLEVIKDITVWSSGKEKNSQFFDGLKSSGRQTSDLLVKTKPQLRQRLTLDLQEMIRYKKIQVIQFYIEKFLNGTPFSLELLLEDRKIFSRRATYQIKQSMKGEKMTLDFSDEDVTREYFITIRQDKIKCTMNTVLLLTFTWQQPSQEEFPEDDPDNPCTVYPNRDYQSFADCDDHYVRTLLPDDLVPFWMCNEEDMSQATNNYTAKQEELDKLDSLMGKYPDCNVTNWICNFNLMMMMIYCLKRDMKQLIWI